MTKKRTITPEELLTQMMFVAKKLRHDVAAKGFISNLYTQEMFDRCMQNIELSCEDAIGMLKK